MAIFQYTNDGIRELAETNFQSAGITERGDLQRLLRDQIEIVAPDCLVISEEFGDWEESKRRIDLLAIDSNADLVVIELKRTEDGGHMELQAVRYAAMVSTMTFERAVMVYAAYLAKRGLQMDAEQALLDFLNWEEPDEEAFATDVRIVLVSANFSRELTTTVMWLADRDLDIRCIRLKPYQQDGHVFLDVQQIIPLPEIEEFQIQIREKERHERKSKTERSMLLRQFWTELLAHAKTRTDLHSNVAIPERSYLSASAGHRGLSFHYQLSGTEGSIALYISTGDEAENNAILDRLLIHRDAVEAAFGGTLEWGPVTSGKACRVRKVFAGTGYKSEREKWPNLIDQMVDGLVRLEAAISPHLPDAIATQSGLG